MKISLPNLKVPMVATQDKEGKGLNPISPWIQFFAALVADPSAFEPVTLGASPYDLEVIEPGTVSVVGGTVSAVAIVRGSVVLATGMTSGMFRVGSGDILRIVYTVVPVVTFIPG